MSMGSFTHGHAKIAAYTTKCKTIRKRATTISAVHDPSCPVWPFGGICMGGGLSRPTLLCEYHTESMAIRQSIDSMQ